MSFCASTFRVQIKLFTVVKRSWRVFCFSDDLVEDYSQFEDLATFLMRIPLVFLGHKLFNVFHNYSSFEVHNISVSVGTSHFPYLTTPHSSLLVWPGNRSGLPSWRPFLLPYYLFRGAMIEEQGWIIEEAWTSIHDKSFTGPTHPFIINLSGIGRCGWSDCSNTTSLWFLQDKVREAWMQLRELGCTVTPCFSITHPFPSSG